MPVKAISNTTATPEPMIMPHMRCRPCRPRQAIAITSALSPESRMLIQMILPTASQNVGFCMSAWNCGKNAPILAGSNTCVSQSTACPSPSRPPVRLYRISAHDLVAGEKLRDLDRRGLPGGGAVRRVLADRLGVNLADGAVRRLRRIGSAHHVAIFRN